METWFAPPAGISVAFAVVAAFLVSILPTCLYLYVEPRGRRHWAAEGDTPSKRRAPALVRVAAWLSFALGQIAVPWLLIPAACGALAYLQLKLGIARPLGLGATAVVGAMALVQALLALRLFPLGVKLLVRDARVCERAGGRARNVAMINAAVLAAGLLISWAMEAIPGFAHPWLRTALAWTALRPVMGLAAVGLLHALLLGRCASALRDANVKVE